VSSIQINEAILILGKESMYISKN